MVFLATVLFSLALFVCRREVAERIVVSALSLWLAYESVLGIMQLLGIAVSHNSMCPMTGGFANSGPYGGFLAVCIAVVFAAAWRWRDSVNLYDRILFWLSSVSGCLGIVVLPASMSRTGFVALVVSAVAFALIDTESKSYLKSHKWLILSVIAVTFGLVAWDTFAMASYPLAVWQLRLLLAVFLGAAIGVSVKVGKKGRLILVPALVCLSVGSMLVWLPENKHRKEAESTWLEERRFADFEIFDGMADRLAELYPLLRMKFRYLYDEAERNYIHSHNMVPSRLYPYILLMEMEEKRGDTKQALSYARKALSLPVNDRNMSMRDLHNRAKKFYDEHSEDY